jgi:hypothetical protein
VVVEFADVGGEDVTHSVGVEAADFAVHSESGLV